jgi:cell division protein FtsB
LDTSGQRGSSGLTDCALAEKKMAKKTKELEDLVQEIEHLIAELAHLQRPPSEERLSPADQSLGGGTDRTTQGTGPPAPA